MKLISLRKIAKSNKFQAMYRRAKETGMIKIFRNSFDLSKIQEWFLHYLEVYEMMYRDLSNGENYISQQVIDNDLRADAYLLLRTREGYKKQKKTDKKTVDTSSNIPSIIFKRK